MEGTKNMLLEEVQWKVEETGFGTWKRHLNAAGQAYAEFVSHRRLFGMPLVHYTAGRNPETGRRKMARGFVAVGRVSVGVVAVGQAAVGVVSVGQLSLGTVLGVGQVCCGLLALGQVSIGVLVGIGQVATGVVAIGQAAFGMYVLAQSGAGIYVWDANGVDPTARWLFHKLPFWK